MGVSSCQHSKTVWADGEKVLNYLHQVKISENIFMKIIKNISLKNQVDTLGLTGEIRFDTEGFRTDIQLDLIEKVGRRRRRNSLKVCRD